MPPYGSSCANMTSFLEPERIATPPEEDRSMAIDSICHSSAKFSEDWTSSSGDMLTVTNRQTHTDKQTNIHTRHTTPQNVSNAVFTARCYASAVLAMALCPSVCLSVTSHCSPKTAKRRIPQTTPHDSPGTLVSCCQRSPRNSTGVTPYEGAECRWGGSKSATFDQ